MKETLQVVNQMESDGVIGKYVIGGAIGASFYVEPTTTYDIDIFIPFQRVPGSAFVSLSPIYEYLRKQGYEADGDSIVIKDWKVQFLPVDDPLYKEALAEAVETTFKDVKIRIMTPEHIMAIAIKTGRNKDFIRLDQFLNKRVYDEKKFNDILDRHGLREQFNKFKLRFAGGVK
jgi:hypothetical protein